MRYPMLNVRKQPGRRGESIVSRMRLARQGETRTMELKPGDRRAARSQVLPSQIHAGQTGTLQPKDFRGMGGRTQPTRPVPFMGGLQSYRFGD